MEIISYSNTKRPFSTQTTTLSLEDMLRSQHPNRSTIRATRREREALLTNAVTAMTGFCHFLIKIRFAVPVIFAFLCLATASMWIFDYAQSFASPVNFQTISAPDTAILAGEMHDFALASESMQADTGSDPSLIYIEEEAILFSRPVSFSSYMVQSGDSISSISEKFNLENISTLIGVNDIANTRLLRAGQEIEIPSADGLRYTIKTGDSLASIAQSYGASVESILDVNELSSSVLLPGDNLFIPGALLDSTSLKKALGNNERFTAPLSVPWRISSSYGYRADPFTGTSTFHTGVDLAVPRGTPVKAAMSGIVSVAGYSNVYGNYVIINHGNGYQTLYAHFMSPAPVKVGQSTAQGGVIGYVGSTGYSTGNHLHFTVYKNGVRINPTEILKF